jgi:hypothetical protein
MAALAVTAALAELNTLVDEIVVSSTGVVVRPGVVVAVLTIGAALLLCAVPSVYTAVDVEVEVTVTMTPVPLAVTVVINGGSAVVVASVECHFGK